MDVFKMKFKGRIFVLSMVLLTNCLYIAYYYMKDGHIERIEIIGLPLILLIAWWSGKQYDKVKHLEDINLKKKKELHNSNQMFRTLFENAPIGISLIDQDGRPVLTNKKLQEILGYNEDELNAMTFSEFSDPDDSAINMDLLKDLLDGKIDHYELEKRYYHKDGHVVWGIVTSALYPDIDNETTYVIGMLVDITERKIAEQKLKEAYKEKESLSNRDGLTGIANRRYFDEYLVQEFEKARKTASPLSLIIIDIDYFKQYNDCYGHLKGDECLKQVANVFEKTIDQSKGVAARFGGEEFVILLPKIDTLGASVIANQIQGAIENLRISHIGSEISEYLTVSLGLSTFNMESTSLTPEDLISEADQALYLAKQSSRNRIEIYH
ncbi:diguanylate cyclase [Lysinibacillus sp. BW-2-10]|nr:diguanylate cyclase [Lysinibacillus sp. BW-2-10]